MQVILDEMPNSYKSSSRRRSRTVKIGIGIVLGIVLGNAVGYGAHRFMIMREENRMVQKDELEEQSHRAAGLGAMKVGDYDTAIRELQAALDTASPAPDLPDLLKLAQQLQEEDARKKLELEEEAAARAIEATEKPRREVSRSAVSKSVKNESDELEPGLLLVTTTPSHITIYVDREPKDMSPARLEVEPGTHLIELKHASETLFEKRIRFRPTKVVTLNPDFTEKLGRVANESPRDTPSGLNLPPPRIISGSEAAAGDAPDDATFPPSRRDTSTTQLTAKPTELPSTPPLDRLSGVDRSPTPNPAAARNDAVPEVATPPAPKQEYTKGGLLILPGSLVREVMSDNLERIKRCYRQALRRDPYLAGGVEVRAVVLSSGKLKANSIEVRTDMAVPSLKFCVGREVRSIQFPKNSIKETSFMSSKFDFQPED